MTEPQTKMWGPDADSVAISVAPVAVSVITTVAIVSVLAVAVMVRRIPAAVPVAVPIAVIVAIDVCAPAITTMLCIGAVAGKTVVPPIRSTR